MEAVELWIKQIFSAPEFGILVLPAGFLLGLITSFSCVSCSAPILAAIVGYAGSREGEEQRDVLFIAGFFMIGAVIALAVAGLLVGYIGQVAGNTFGLYGKILIAILTIFFGFAALNLLPFKLPSINFVDHKVPAGIIGASIFGLAVGAISISFTMACCGPMLLPIVLGVSALKGEGVWGVLILTTFAIGYSLPLVAAILGIGLGRLTTLVKKIAVPIQIISGIILIIAGFWLLITL